jgi:hypothetical protein
VKNLTSQIIDADLEPKETGLIEMDISENTDKVNIIANAEDVSNEKLEIVIGWYQEKTRVGGQTSTLDDSPFQLEPFADTLKVQVRNEHENKRTKVNGNIREKKRG